MKQNEQYIETNFLCPAFGERNTAIFFNSDDKYAPYLATTINSLLFNASDRYNYDLIVLTEDMTDDKICMLRAIIEQKANFSLRFFNMKSYYEKYKIAEFKITKKHLTPSAYFRIFSPWIFKNYDSIVYLDSDVIVNEDIAELANIPFEDKSVIAIADYYASDSVFSQLDQRFLQYSKEILKIDNLSTYFNSGVMSLNLEKIRKKYSVEQFVDIAKVNNYRFNDQNVLNSVLYGDTKLIEPEWNFQNSFDLHPDLFARFGRPIDKLKIIHFCTRVKPWNRMNLRFADIWWYYARGTMFYERILTDMIKSSCLEDILQNRHEHSKKKDADIGGIVRTILDKREYPKKDETANEIVLSFIRRKYWKYRILSRLTFGRTKARYIHKEATYLKRLKDITDD